MSYDGADIGFVGQAYDAPDPYQDSQKAVNWFVEVSQDDKSKTPAALLGAPGLNVTFDFSITTDGIAIPNTGGVRGCWVLPGGVDTLWVVGATVIRTRMTVPATQTSIAQFSKSFAGTLLTNSGPVSIADNGFASGTPTACIVDGPYGYYYDITGGGITQITAAGFLGADRVDFIDGWFLFTQPGTQKLYTTGPTPYALTFPGAFFAQKDSSSDNIVTHKANNREWWIIGERTSEVWYDAGGANFASRAFQACLRRSAAAPSIPSRGLARPLYGLARASAARTSSSRPTSTATRTSARARSSTRSRNTRRCPMPSATRTRGRAPVLHAHVPNGG
jgi:hypothetical protein